MGTQLGVKLFRGRLLSPSDWTIRNRAAAPRTSHDFPFSSPRLAAFRWTRVTFILHSLPYPLLCCLDFMNGRKLRLLFDVLGSREMCRRSWLSGSWFGGAVYSRGRLYHGRATSSHHSISFLLGCMAML